MPGLTNIQKIYESPMTHYDALEGILEPVLNLQATWDGAYGNVTRGIPLKIATGKLPLSGNITGDVARPMIVGKVVAVAGSTVTLEKGAAAGAGLVGKTLTKVTSAGVVSALATTVAGVVDEKGATESRSLYRVVITFTAAHGLVVGDFVGCEGLTGTDKADGISYESHNYQDDPTVAVTVRGVFKNDHVAGPDAFKVAVLQGRVRYDLLLFRTY